MILDLKEIVITGCFKDNHDEIEYDGEYERAKYDIDKDLLLKCYREYKQDNELEIDDFLDDYDIDEFINEYNDYLIERGKRVNE